MCRAEAVDVGGIHKALKVKVIKMFSCDLGVWFCKNIQCEAIYIDLGIHCI